MAKDVLTQVHLILGLSVTEDLNHHHNSAEQNQVSHSQSGKMIIQPTFLLSSVLVNNSPAPDDLLTADWMKC